MRKAFGTAVLD